MDRARIKHLGVCHVMEIKCYKSLHWIGLDDSLKSVTFSRIFGCSGPSHCWLLEQLPDAAAAPADTAPPPKSPAVAMTMSKTE